MLRITLNFMQYSDLMLGQCFTNVGGMSYQCWGNVLPMLGECLTNVGGMSYQCWGNVLPMLGECLTNVGGMSYQCWGMSYQCWGMSVILRFLFFITQSRAEAFFFFGVLGKVCLV